MKVVKTFTQEDFDALVAAGMDYQQEPINTIGSVQFLITDQVFEALDLDNRHDLNIKIGEIFKMADEL